MDLAQHAELMRKLKLDGNVVDDGPIVPERYAVSRPRILWILREVNGDAGWSYPEFLATDENLFGYRHWNRSLGLVAKCSAGILRGCVPWGDWAADASKLTDALRDIAIVNLNKRAGDTTVNWNTFGEKCAEHANVVTRQLDLLEPEVVILGNVAGFCPKEFPVGINGLSGIGQALRHRKQLFVNMYHPQQSKLTHRVYYDLLIGALRSNGLCPG